MKKKILFAIVFLVTMIISAADNFLQDGNFYIFSDNKATLITLSFYPDIMPRYLDDLYEIYEKNSYVVEYPPVKIGGSIEFSMPSYCSGFINLGWKDKAISGGTYKIKFSNLNGFSKEECKVTLSPYMKEEKDKTSKIGYKIKIIGPITKEYIYTIFVKNISTDEKKIKVWTPKDSDVNYVFQF